MKKRRNVGKRLSIFTIVLALIAAILIVYVFNLWMASRNLKLAKEIEKTDKDKYSEVFYDNGWDRNIVAEIKEDIPIPKGFEYVSGTKDTGFIIQDKANSQKMMWIPYDESVSIDNIDEYYASAEYDTINYKSYKNMTKYGGFYVLLSEINEYGLIKNIDQETYNSAKVTAENLYKENETVNSHLVYKTEIEQVLAFAKKIGINVEQTKSEKQTDIKVDKLIQSDLSINKIDNENLNLSLVAVDIETDSKLNDINGFNQDNWFIYDVPVIIKTPSGKELSVPVPVGFDVEVDNNVVTITAQGEYNLSYVWIPVDEEFNTKDFSEEGLSQMTISLKQAYGIADKTQEEILNYSKDPTDTIEFQMLQRSVEEYGGFYMGQAELGFDNETQFNNQVRGLSYITDEQTGEKESYAKNGDYYRSVSAETVKENTTQNNANYDNSALERDSDGGYTLTYEKSKELIDQVNKENMTVSSNLVYGAQWNAALLWIINSGYNIEQLVQNSEYLPGAKYEYTEWEKEADAIKTINGLYGIAGNLSDITQETYSESNSNNTLKQMSNTNIQSEEYHIGRGGNYGTTGQEKTASGYQIINNQTIETDSYGIRDCLILYVTDMDEEILNQDTTTTGNTISNNYEIVKTANTYDSSFWQWGYNGGKLEGNGKAILIADLIHSWLVRHNVTYTVSHTKQVPDVYGYTDCSHYMSLILYEYGHTAPFIWDNYGKRKVAGATTAQFVTTDFATMVTKGATYFGMNGVKTFYKGAYALKPGDMLLMYNDSHIQMYAGNNRWYNAGSDTWIKNSKSNGCEAPYIDDGTRVKKELGLNNKNPWNWSKAIRLTGSADLSYGRMEYLFKIYNSKAWEECCWKIQQVKNRYGSDQAVLFTIINLAKSRGIINGECDTYIDRHLWG